jgi:nucleoside-diphosphate-sugar epimerase
MSPRPTIAVIGANGFIGSRIVEMLVLEELAAVRPIVRRPSALASSSRFGLEGRIAEASDRTALRVALDGVDVVVLAIAGDPATITGTIGPVFEAASEARCRRLVYLSSASVHGQAPAPGTDESSPLSERQLIAYNNAKVRAERELFERRSGGALEAVALRPAIVFGPRSQWTAGLADALLAGEAYLVDGGGGVCNSVYVDNLVRAVWLAATTAGADGRTYLIGDDEAPTWREFYRALAEPLGISIDDVPSVPFRPARLAATALMDAARESASAQAVVSRLPDSARRVLRSLRAVATETETRAGRVRPTLEMALLQRCRYRLPWTRARAELAYRPEVEFAEALRRSIGWLAFAGYPVVAGYNPPEQADGGRREQP